MSWFSFFRKKQKNKKYIIKDSSGSKTHAVTELVKIIKLNKGYTSSPYSKKYIKPDSTQHEYIPIKTTFSNEPVPLAKPKEEENIHARVPDREVIESVPSDIDHYETLKLVNQKEVEVVEATLYKKENKKKAKAIIEEKTEEVIVGKLEEPDESQDFVLPEAGKIFVMNGYGVNVKCNEQEVVAYIDTGVDVNIDKGQEVLLHHWGGSYDKKRGIILSGTDTERTGNVEEILIQNV
jgi:hypothetical protein|tara:strand:- start:175 stop:882 length:708 start_codon:yes stop_codon:yes gene_type:complete